MVAARDEAAAVDEVVLRTPEIVWSAIAPNLVLMLGGVLLLAVAYGVNVLIFEAERFEKGTPGAYRPLYAIAPPEF